MKKSHLSDEDAYKLIQKENTNSRKSIKDVCEALILADAVVFG